MRVRVSLRQPPAEELQLHRTWVGAPGLWVRGQVPPEPLVSEGSPGSAPLSAIHKPLEPQTDFLPSRLMGLLSSAFRCRRRMKKCETFGPSHPTFLPEPVYLHHSGIRDG